MLNDELVSYGRILKLIRLEIEAFAVSILYQVVQKAEVVRLPFV